VPAKLRTHSLQADGAVRHFIDPAVCTAAPPVRRAFAVAGLDAAAEAAERQATDASGSAYLRPPPPCVHVCSGAFHTCPLTASSHRC
jgi:hypothetical protein